MDEIASLNRSSGPALNDNKWLAEQGELDDLTDTSGPLGEYTLGRSVTQYTQAEIRKDRRRGVRRPARLPSHTRG